MTLRLLTFTVLGAGLLVAACGSRSEPQEAPVRSHLEGELTLNPSVDSTITDQSGFELLVMRQDSTGIDTLGYAQTDSAGRFQMDIAAPESGIYPLVVSRQGPPLKIGELVVTDGDSARLRAQVPSARPFLVRSPENDAWSAYRNSKAQYSQSVTRLLQGGASTEALGRAVVQTSGILWSLRENFPETLAAQLAGAEAVTLLDGWDDSLLVARARAIPAGNAGIVNVVRAARRALGRLAGPDSALAFVERIQGQVDDEGEQAALQAELVQTYMEAERREEALEAAAVLRETYPGSPWTTWAGRATYELENLMPGMEAPALEATTLEGEPIRLRSLRGQRVVLEFYDPADLNFQRQLEQRASLVAAPSLALVSISLQPDSTLNEAFLEGRTFPGRRIIAPGGTEDPLVRAYNVNVVPTRYLIDEEGRIAGKYVGAALGALLEEIGEAEAE